MQPQSRILVIRHGALGDVILSTGPFAAIRAHHKDAHITLLTTPPYAKLLRTSPWFDAIWIDPKPKPWQLRALLQLVKKLRGGGFDRVYDLQTSKRSARYFSFFPFPKPEWSGISKGASHRHHTPERTKLHTLDRQKQQLAIAGIHHVPPPDLSWLKGDVNLLPKREGAYALLVPGGSAHRPEKRWTRQGFTEIARWLAQERVTPLLIGTNAEKALLEAIAADCPEAVNLCNRTDFGQLAELARGATLALGNDTGPMHLIAAAGCPSLVLFSHTSNPDLCAPRGEKVRVLRSPNLEALQPQEVRHALAPFFTPQ